MNKRISLTSSDITSETPLRLSVAALLAFPDGSVTASGLRKEAARGRLVIERIAGKLYTTPANIERMRELCRVNTKGLTFISAPSVATGERTGSSAIGSTASDMKKAHDAALAIVEGLSDT
jgi:hypothetical protein